MSIRRAGGQRRPQTPSDPFSTCEKPKIARPGGYSKPNPGMTPAGHRGESQSHGPESDSGTDLD